MCDTKHCYKCNNHKPVDGGKQSCDSRGRPRWLCAQCKSWLKGKASTVRR